MCHVRKLIVHVAFDDIKEISYKIRYVFLLEVQKVELSFINKLTKDLMLSQRNAIRC